jgi:hypothetical protein
VVNLSSSEGHLKKIPGESLRKMFANPSLTEEELTDLMKQFVTLVQCLYFSAKTNLYLDIIGLFTRSTFRAVFEPITLSLTTYPLAG